MACSARRRTAGRSTSTCQRSQRRQGAQACRVCTSRSALGVGPASDHDAALLLAKANAGCPFAPVSPHLSLACTSKPTIAQSLQVRGTANVVVDARWPEAKHQRVSAARVAHACLRSQQSPKGMRCRRVALIDRPRWFCCRGQSDHRSRCHDYGVFFARVRSVLSLQTAPRHLEAPLRSKRRWRNRAGFARPATTCPPP